LRAFHPPRTNRGSDVPIRSPKAETQKQQTHLNHVAAAVLIGILTLARREEGDTNYCARAGNYCHTLRDCVVTQSPQADQQMSSAGGCSNDPWLRSTSAASTRTHKQGTLGPFRILVVHSSSPKELKAPETLRRRRPKDPAFFSSSIPNLQPITLALR
jgi:hypothetical protein